MCFKVQVKHCVLSSFKAASCIDCIEDNEEHRPMAQFYNIRKYKHDIYLLYLLFILTTSYLYGVSPRKLTRPDLI